MRRVIAVTCAAMPFALLGAMASCSSVPSYVVAGDGSVDPLADASLVDGTEMDGGSASYVVTLPDGGKCYAKRGGEHFRFFMTREGWEGNLLARKAGERPDELCRARGSTAWPGTDWKAYFWSSASSHPSSQLVEVCDGWWVSAQGKGDYLVFPSKASLYGTPLGDINISEEHLPITSGALQVWTGGDQLNVSASARCNGWGQTAGAVGTTGWPSPNLERWMKDVVDRGCTALGHLYCIEVP